MKINVPELCMVVLVGPSGAGKSTFARKHFLETEVLSSDRMRAWISDDETDQNATGAAFEVLHLLARKRLQAGKLVVVDATNVQEEARKKLLKVAKDCHVAAVAIVLNLSPRLCHGRNRQRENRNFGSHVVRRQHKQLQRTLKGFRKEGFRRVHVLDNVEDIEQVTVHRRPMRTNLKHECGPFDLIGDVHGCYDELLLLLDKLGYQVQGAHSENPVVLPPEGRKAFFVGDLVDRGPNVVGVLRLVMGMVKAGTAFCVTGNHENRMFRKLSGKNVALNHGLQETMEQLTEAGEAFCEEVRDFVDHLPHHYVADGGRLVVAHAGLIEEYHGRTLGKVRSFAMYGDVTGEKDEFGLPVRNDWARDYRGRAFVVYGHTPQENAVWKNRTINIDTGCVFGGKLTALQYPERTLHSVDALELYCEPGRPFKGIDSVQRREYNDLLDRSDVQGRRVVETRLHHGVTLREGQSAAALEAMSRFAIDPRWLITLPPTMSPSATSKKEGYLEYPTEAFQYFRREGVNKVICEEKHMGSRIIVVVCKDADVARHRFGIDTGEQGVCFTRTGRPFFSVKGIERGLLKRLHLAMERSGLWEELETDWACFDCELMPWSSKAQVLLEQQYAPVGRAAERSLQAAMEVLEVTNNRGIDVSGLLKKQKQRQQDVEEYVEAYRGYCWPVKNLMDLRLAPFHLLATEGSVHVDKDHLWHMDKIARLCEKDSKILQLTNYKVVDLSEDAQVEDATRWWEEMTEAGGEGMVVKPLKFVTYGEKGLVQPALKCRGRRYLRIIYGPEYTEPDNLQRLRQRGLGHKRSLALREFALGIEALERFVRKEPLYRVHECAFGVMALESDPVDPRL